MTLTSTLTLTVALDCGSPTVPAVTSSARLPETLVPGNMNIVGPLNVLRCGPYLIHHGLHQDQDLKVFMVMLASGTAWHCLGAVSAAIAVWAVVVVPAGIWVVDVVAAGAWTRVVVAAGVQAMVVVAAGVRTVVVVAAGVRTVVVVAAGVRTVVVVAAGVRTMVVVAACVLTMIVVAAASDCMAVCEVRTAS